MSSNEELEEMIRHLQTKMVYLEGRVAQLETGRYPYPVNPTWPTTPPGPFYNKPKCGKCGIELSNVMGYVCPDAYCPTFMKAVAYSVAGTQTASVNASQVVERKKVDNPGWSDYESARHGEYYDGKWYPDRSR
jgi:hypothetical protein